MAGLNFPTQSLFESGERVSASAEGHDASLVQARRTWRTWDRRRRRELAGARRLLAGDCISSAVLEALLEVKNGHSRKHAFGPSGESAYRTERDKKVSEHASTAGVVPSEELYNAPAKRQRRNPDG